VSMAAMKNSSDQFVGLREDRMREGEQVRWDFGGLHK
jgi:hypothetical protein